MFVTVKKTFPTFKQFVSKVGNQPTGAVIMTTSMLFFSMVRRLFAPVQLSFLGHSNPLTLKTTATQAKTLAGIETTQLVLKYISAMLKDYVDQLVVQYISPCCHFTQRVSICPNIREGLDCNE